MYFMHFTEQGKALHVVSENTGWSYPFHDCRRYESLADMNEDVFNSVEFIIVDALAMREQMIDFSSFPNLTRFVIDMEETVNIQIKQGMYTAAWLLETMLPSLALTARNIVHFRFICVPRHEDEWTGENTDVFGAHEELMQIFQQMGVM